MRAFRLILLSSLYQSQLVVCNQGESDISLWLFELPKILPAGFCLETVLVLSCSPPHPQSWLQVKWPQSEERRTPVGDNEGFKPTVLWQGLCIACRKMWHQSTTLYKAPKPEPSALFVSVKWIQVRSRGRIADYLLDLLMIFQLCVFFFLYCRHALTSNVCTGAYIYISAGYAFMFAVVCILNCRWPWELWFHRDWMSYI